jgi:phosphoribosylformylglycinamidine synthase
MVALTNTEIHYLKEKLQREPNPIELDLVGAEWSEHCSYKSSRRYLRLLPTKGRRVIMGPGQDAGVLDVDDGFVMTIHIESHNHPSAVEPYGGAATGVGGVIRDIMSMGTRPIAILDALRFAPITSETKKYSKSKWLFKNVVRGIGDYGNCIGVPTVGGEVEFDPSFQDYCLVDVASIGFGIRGQIIENKVDTDDLIILAGGSTGRDGIHGSSFASAILQEENRSAVQIPDPFLEKLLVEATAEAVEECCIKAMKDLGGGGLSCCLAETADNLKRGFDIELTNVHAKHQNMSPSEIMISESQERMLYITDGSKINRLISIFKKYEIPYALIGKVTDGHSVIIRFCGKVVADLPAELFAHAPTAHRGMQRPQYLDRLEKSFDLEENTPKLNSILLAMLSSPTIANKNWVYQQYDHEVGLRTIVKPGQGDASVMRIGNGKFASIKLDGNSKHCYLDPYQGTLGCLSEACRNIICTGAEPIGIIDHLQFAHPESPAIFWTFIQAIKAISDYCEFMDIPVVGGKVSFYNGTPRGPIKPSPVIGAVGLIEKESYITESALKPGDSIFIVGFTFDEMGGSEYYEYYHNIVGGTLPALNLDTDKINANAVLELIRSNLIDCAHDCSKGGLGVALCKMAILGNVGVTINLGLVPNSCSRLDGLLFSESQSRYIIGTSEPDAVKKLLLDFEGLKFAQIGNASKKKYVKFINEDNKPVVEISIEKLSESFNTLNDIMNGKKPKH